MVEHSEPVETSTGSLGSTLTDPNTLSALNGSPTVEASRCQPRTSLCISSGQTYEMYGLCSLKSPNMQLRAPWAKKRPQLEKLLSQLRKDDVLVVTKLDRLAWSTSELLRIAEVLNEKNAGLQSLDEPWADTTTPAGKMIMTVFGGIAEFERSLILTRTQEGREAALARGVLFGRPSKLSPDQKEVVRDLVKNGQSIAAVARTFNVHPATIYRCLERKTGLMIPHRSIQPDVPARAGL